MKTNLIEIKQGRPAQNRKVKTGKENKFTRAILNIFTRSALIELINFCEEIKSQCSNWIQQIVYKTASELGAERKINSIHLQ